MRPSASTAVFVGPPRRALLVLVFVLIVAPAPRRRCVSVWRLYAWRDAWRRRARHSPIRRERCLRGAHSAISGEALVPQANRSSMVPMTRKARPATKDTAASGSSGPMTWAPAMTKSPRMPPSPFGSGQLRGWGSAGERGGEQEDRGGPGEEAGAGARFGTRAEDEMPAPGGERQEQDDGGKPQGLDGEVGDHRAPGAEQVAGRGPGRIVEARVVHRPGGEARPGGASRRHDAKAIGAEHEPAQAGLDRSRQQLSPLLLLSALIAIP